MIIQYIKLSILELLNNKLRTFLSLIGIVIGVMVVYIILSLGDITNVAVSNAAAGGKATFEVIYTKDKKNKDTVFNDSVGINFGSENKFYFEPQDTEVINEVEGVKEARVNYLTYSPLTYNKITLNLTVKNYGENYLEFYNTELLTGKSIDDYPDSQKQNLVIIEESVVKNLKISTNEEAIGKKIKLINREFTIVGVIKNRAGINFGEQMILISSKAYNQMFSSNISSITVQVKDGYGLEEVSKNVLTSLNEKHNYHNSKNGFVTKDLSFITEQIKGITGALSIIMSIIGSISLLVAGIGVMNIMLVSVVERTREIGIKRALGASKKEIQLQFIIESSVITFVGGFIGIILGILIIKIALVLLKLEMPINLLYVGSALIFSLTLGMIFGYFPAKRAAGLNIIKAIQND